MYSVQEIVKKYENINDVYDFGVRTHNAKEAQNIANILDYYGLILLLEDGDYRTIEAIDYNNIDFTTLPKDITFEI